MKNTLKPLPSFLGEESTMKPLSETYKELGIAVDLPIEKTNQRSFVPSVISQMCS